MHHGHDEEFAGVGLSFRPEFEGFWPSIKSNLDCVEYIPDELQFNRRLLESTKNAVSGLPAMAHSTGLSIGSPELLDPKLLDDLMRTISEVGAVLYSDHLCFRRSGELELDNFCLPMADDASLDVILENIKFYESAIGKHIYLENISINGKFGFAPALQDEIRIFKALGDQGYRILFDVNNAFMNCKNFDVTVANYLNQFPMEAIAGLHIAGHEIDEGWYVDSHMHAISEEVIALTREVLSRSPAAFIVMERDNNSATYDHLMSEIDIIRDVWVAER